MNLFRCMHCYFLRKTHASITTCTVKLLEHETPVQKKHVLGLGTAGGRACIPGMCGIQSLSTPEVEGTTTSAQKQRWTDMRLFAKCTSGAKHVQA